MKLTVEEKDENLIYKIEGSLTVYEVFELREQLLTCIDKNQTLILNLSDVNDCDTCGIQLLYSAYKTAKNMKKNFILSEVSDSIKEALKTIGLNAEELFSQ